MGLIGRDGIGPIAVEGNAGDVVWVAAWAGLGFEVVKWALVGPADEIGALQLGGDFETAFFLEHLLQAFQLGHAFKPFLVLELLLQAGDSECPFGDIVCLFTVEDFEVGQFWIDRGGHIAGEGPGGGGPCKEELTWFGLDGQFEEY